MNLHSLIKLLLITTSLFVINVASRLIDDDLIYETNQIKPQIELFLSPNKAATNSQQIATTTIDYTHLPFLHILKIRLNDVVHNKNGGVLKSTIQFSLNQNSSVFDFPLHIMANNKTSNNFVDLEENLVEVCFKLINSTNLSSVGSGGGGVKLKRLSDFCNENFYHKLARLDLASNQMRAYPSQMLARWFANLDELSLANNSIEVLSGEVNFASQLSRANLKLLDLSLNKLERLDDETFRNLKALRYLNLSKNQVLTLVLSCAHVRKNVKNEDF